MSGKIVQWLWEHSPYTGNKLVVLMAIGWIADDNGDATIALDFLLKRCHLQEKSRPHLIDTLQQLEKDGALTITRNRISTHKNIPNHYRVVAGSSEKATTCSSEKTTTPDEGSSEKATTGSSEKATTCSSEKATTGSSESATKVVANRLPLTTLINSDNLIKQEQHHEEAEAAAPRKVILTEPEAERIYVDVTGMYSIPGGDDGHRKVIGTICNLADKHGSGLAAYLKPFWQAQTLTKTRAGRNYQKTWHYWLDWAIAEELPDYVRQQLLHMPPANLPEELRKMILDGRDTTPSANGKKTGLLATYSQETIDAARALGLLKPKGATQ